MLKCIRDLTLSFNRTPTQREVALQLDISNPTVSGHASVLRGKWLIDPSGKLILTDAAKAHLEPIKCPKCGEEITV